MIGVKVDDDSTWEAVKQGAVKGFSIEGFFVAEKEELTDEEELERMLTQIVQALETK